MSPCLLLTLLPCDMDTASSLLYYTVISCFLRTRLKLNVHGKRNTALLSFILLALCGENAPWDVKSSEDAGFQTEVKLHLYEKQYCHSGSLSYKCLDFKNCHFFFFPSTLFSLPISFPCFTLRLTCLFRFCYDLSYSILYKRKATWFNTLPNKWRIVF